jgi:hypothetical protein
LVGGQQDNVVRGRKLANHVEEPITGCNAHPRDTRCAAPIEE